MRLGERRRGGRERAVDLVGRDVEEAERGALGAGEARPMQAGRLEQGEGALDIRLHECRRSVDAAVDVALRREMDDRARPVPHQKRVDERTVEDVAVDEGVARVAVERREVLAVAGVGEGVEGDDRLAGGGDPVEHEVRADEAGAAGDEDAALQGHPRYVSQGHRPAA
jgi:hypothetical protein